MSTTSYRALFDLSDRVMVVIGAGQGMGRESALGAAELGAHVVCADLDPALAESAARATGGTAWGGNAGSREGVQELCDLSASLGRIGGVLDVVGGSAIENEDEIDLDVVQRMMALNFETAYLVGRTFGHAMKATGGTLVFWASAIAATSAKRMLGYGASKAALISMVKTFAEEYSPYQVRVNAVAPSTILTERMRERWDEETTAANARISLVNRMGTPAEVAATALFLSTDASSYVTGQVVTVDGGASIRSPWAV